MGKMRKQASEHDEAVGCRRAVELSNDPSGQRPGNFLRELRRPDLYISGGEVNDVIII